MTAAADKLQHKLSGRVIALPESRELDLFAAMLEKRGAQTRRCPLIGIHDAPDAAPVETWLKRCCAGEFDDLVLITGEGLRRLLGFAERAGLRDDFVAALAKLRKITRGPKPAKELRQLGLKPDIAAAIPTTEGVIAALAEHDLTGRQLAVQLYGENPNRPLIEFIEQAGGNTHSVAPYIYADDAENNAVADIIRDLAAGQLDAIAFTSSPQLKRMLSVARQQGLEDELASGMSKTLVAAVGPLIADTIREAGFKVDLMPDESFFLKPLVNELVAKLGPSP